MSESSYVQNCIDLFSCLHLLSFLLGMLRNVGVNACVCVCVCVCTMLGWCRYVLGEARYPVSLNCFAVI